MATEANSGSFKPGEGGRPKGAVNKTTKLVKETFAEVFNKLQDHPTANLEAWAIEEPTEFYKLASKLIPTEVTSNNKHLFENFSLKDALGFGSTQSEISTADNE